MAITPPTYTPSGSLLPAKAAVTPYTYGNLPTTTSAYNIWGSKGNPYLKAGPKYTPGAGAPVVPVPIAPTAPYYSGGDSGGSSDYTDSAPSGPRYGDDHPDAPYYNNPNPHYLLGLLNGRIDSPVGDGYSRLPWYESSAGQGYGYTEEGYDQYAPGDTDRGIYDASTGERAWGDEFDDYNTGDTWASTGFFEGMGNLFGGDNWDGSTDKPGPVGDPNWVGPTDRWGSAKDPIAIQAREAIAKAQAVADAKAKVEAEQARQTEKEKQRMVDNKSFSDTDSGSFDEGGNYSDWGSKEEYDDDFGADSTWGDDGGDSGGSSGGGGGGGSYIATAATQALGEEGLTVFEDWRDYMYKVVPEFTVSFGRYRVTAPKIVAEIDTKEDSKRIYKDIWDKHLKPIYDLIVADRDSVKAQDDYRIMVRELMNKYLKGGK